MQVAVRSHDLDLHIAQSTEASGDAGDVVGDDAGIADQHNIGGQALLVLFEEFVQVVRAHFFFSFNHELEVDRLVSGLYHRLQSLDMHEHLTFVIACAAGEDGPFWMQLSLANHRLESR